MPEAVSGYHRLVASGTNRLRLAGVADFAREARRIWQDLADPRAPLGAEFLAPADRMVTRSMAVAYQTAIARRARGEPLAHVTGWVGFRRLLLRSDRRALIPRPETEGLVDHLLTRVPGGRVADLGTGSGCLALALADEGRYDSIVGVDRSQDALALANVNRLLTGLPVDLVRGDWIESLKTGEVDGIVANPPYVTSDEYRSLDRSVREWEPATALEGGADGLGATRTLLEGAGRVVRPGGWIALEVDCTRAAATAGLALQCGWQDVSVHDDLFGRARYLLARRSAAA